MSQATIDKYTTLTEASNMLGYANRSGIEYLIKCGELKAYKIPKGARIVLIEDVKKIMKEMAQITD